MTTNKKNLSTLTHILQYKQIFCISTVLQKDVRILKANNVIIASKVFKYGMKHMNG